MGLFKNKVGRPSNKTIRNRRIAYFTLSLMLVSLLFLTQHMLNSSFNTNNVTGAVKSSRSKGVTTPHVYIKGVDDSLTIADENFAVGTYVDSNKIDSSLVYISNDKKVKVKGAFPSTLYKKVWSGMFTFKVGMYGDNDKLIGSINENKITSSSYEYEFTVNSNVKYIKAEIVLKGFESYPFMESQINIMAKSNVPKVDITYGSSIGLNSSSNIFKVNSYGVYSFHAVIKNENNTNLYYRWFTFTSFDESSKPSYNDLNRCTLDNRSEIVTTGLGLTVSEKMSKRMGLIKVYTTESACKNDKYATADALYSKYFKVGYDKSASISKNKFTLSSKNASIKVNGKEYAKGKAVDFNDIKDNKSSNGTIDNIIFTNENETITVSSSFSSSFYNSKKYYVKYTTYGASKNVINKTDAILIDSSNPISYNTTINANVKSIGVKVYYGTPNSDDSNLVSEEVRKFAIKPTVTFEDVSKNNNTKLNLTANSSGVYVVNSYLTYNTQPTLINPSGASIYYRWFTFSDLNAKGATGYGNDGSGNACKIVKDTKITLGNPGLLINEKTSKKRSGKIVVYSSYDECRKDRSSNNSTNLSVGIVNYEYKANSSNKNNIVIELSDKNNNTMNTDGSYSAKSNTKYYPKAIVTNNSGKSLYYRWYTYVGLNASKYRYTDGKECKVLPVGKSEITNLENLEVYSSDRSGKFKVYNTSDECDKDYYSGNSSSYLNQAIINYKVKQSTVTTTKKTSYNMNLGNEKSDLYVLAHIIYAEAGNQGDTCQRAVGSVILNRANSKDFPNTIYDVVFAKGQYEPTWSGTYYNQPSQQAINNAKYLLENGITISTEYVYQMGNCSQLTGTMKIDGCSECFGKGWKQ